MRPNKIKALWKDGKPAIIGWLASGSPFLAEVMANSGYDGVVIDMQHGMGITPDKAIACLQAISTTDTVPMVRVPWNDPFHMQYVLDAGAYGIIVPMINNQDDAVKAAGACRYPPMGYRSVGPNRARLYAGGDYFDHANEEIIVLVMIETQEGISNLEKIAKVPGVDGFYIGPSDLAISLGLPPGFESSKDPRHIAACNRILEAAKDTGVIPGHHSWGPESAVSLIKQGFQICCAGSDAGFISAGSASALEKIAPVRG